MRLRQGGYPGTSHVKSVSMPRRKSSSFAGSPVASSLSRTFAETKQLLVTKSRWAASVFAGASVSVAEVAPTVARKSESRSRRYSELLKRIFTAAPTGKYFLSIN